MPLDANHPLSDENICQVLIKQQLISARKSRRNSQEKELFKNEDFPNNEKRTSIRTCHRHALKRLLP